MSIDALDQKTLDCIKASIAQQRTVNENWGKYAEFIYNKSLSQEDIQTLQDSQRDTFDFNIVEPFIWKSLKNVADSSMVATYKANVDEESDLMEGQALKLDEIVDILNQKFLQLQEKSNYKNVIYGASVDSFIGGKGIIHIKTDYQNNYDFSQTFFIERCLNPTRVYFDNKARHATKKDSEYCFEIVSLSQSEFEEQFPAINIERINLDSYGDGQPVIARDEESDKKLVNVINYYYKVNTYENLYLLKNNGKMTKNKPANSDSIVKIRKVKKTKIMFKVIVGNQQVKAPVETNFKSLPYVMVMGKRFYDKNDKEHIIPFAKHAFDAQRVKNMMMNFFMYEAINNQTATVLLPIEASLDKTEEALRSPTVKKLIKYKGIHQTPSNQNVLLKPEIIPSTPIPTQYVEVFEALDKTVEATLGGAMPSLDETNMSGKALYNLSQFISAANEQFIQHLSEAVEQVASIILEAMPAVLEKETFTLEQKDEEIRREFDFMFDHELMQIAITRGVDNKLQQEATIEKLIDFGKENQKFNEFLNTAPGVTLILENSDMNNKDKVMKEWEDFVENSEKAQPQLNLEQQLESEKIKIEGGKVEAQTLGAQAAMKKVELQAMEVGLDQRNEDHNRDLEYHKIHSANVRNTMDNTAKMAQTNTDYKKHLIDKVEAHHGNHSNESNESAR